VNNKTVHKTSGSSRHPRALHPRTLHPRNLHHGRYDLEVLSRAHAELAPYITTKPDGDKTIDFNDSDAVLRLNQALLAYFYKVNLWQIPEGYLCPPIPGRADYIHYLADVLALAHNGEVPRGKQVRVLDIGCGANCIYPIIGSQVYGWQFVGVDIDDLAVNCAKNIVQSNPNLSKHIKLRSQTNPDSIFEGIIGPNDVFDLTVCNPPFHASMAEAAASNQRKQKNLRQHRGSRASAGQKYAQNTKAEKNGLERNFGGQGAELWCPGGEIQFLDRMARESQLFAEQVGWFSSLVSKQENVLPTQKLLKHLGAKKVQVINMSQGQKISRCIVWKFRE